MRRRALQVLAGSFVVVASCIAATPAWAPLNYAPARAWVTNGPVYDVARLGDTVYLGGDFTRVGPPTGPGAAINRTTGQPDLAFPEVGGGVGGSEVTAVISDGRGGWYIGGNFTYVGGTRRPYVAHILADKTVDPTFDAAVADRDVVSDDPIKALALFRSTLYVGGRFFSMGGRPRSGIAALSARTGKATSWNPRANGCFSAKGYVSAFAVSRSTVYAGGCFRSIGGKKRKGVAALERSSGRATAWNPRATGRCDGRRDYTCDVSSLAVAGSRIYVGGRFGSIGGRARKGLAALDRRTGRAVSWDPSPGGPPSDCGGNSCFGVSPLAVSGSTVYVAGPFESIGGERRLGLAALDAVTGRATPWNPGCGGPEGGPCWVTTRSIVPAGSTVYVGGGFKSIGGQARNGIAAIDAQTGQATPWNPDAGGQVFALAVSASTVYAGGRFSLVGGETRSDLAALDATTGQATPWNPRAECGTAMCRVNALAVAGSTVYAGGDFTSIGGQGRNRLAAIDATSGLLTSWNPNCEPQGCTVLALAISGPTIYVGGYFGSAGGQPRNNLAAIDAVTGGATSWDPNPNSMILALGLSGSTVYVGGSFTSVGGQTRNGIAALDAASGQATAWNPNPAIGGVSHIAIADSTVYASGNFITIGGQNRAGLAALDAQTGQATPWNPTSGGGTAGGAIAVGGGHVYVASFSNPNSPRFGGCLTETGRTTARFGLAELDAATGEPTAWCPRPDRPVEALAVANGILYVGGSFTSIGGTARQGIAWFGEGSPEPPRPPPSPPPAAKRCVVPRVIGLRLTQAKRAIRSANCSVGRIERARSARPAGRVVDQRPRPGRRVRKGTRVTLVVSRGRR